MFHAIQQKIQRQRKRHSLIQELSTSQPSNETTATIDQLVQQEEAFNREALIALLSGTTAVIHIYLGGTLFILNGAGFLLLLAAHYAVPQRESYQQWTRDGMLGYTGVTVAGYALVRGVSGLLDPVGIGTKLVELGLMRVLWADREAAEQEPVFVFENEAQLFDLLTNEPIDNKPLLT